MSKKAPLFSFKYILHDFVKWFASWQCLLFYRVKLRYDGKEAKKVVRGGAFVISNHVAFSDPFVLQCCMAYRRFHFLVMEDVCTNKFVRWNYKHVFLSTFVNREKPSLSTIKECSKLASDGNLVALFPEGHINTDKDNLDPFKGGAVLMAYRAGVPIIPVYHEKRKSIWNMTRCVIGKPIDVKTEIGPVLSQDKIKEVSNKLHEYEKVLMEICRRK